MRRDFLDLLADDPGALTALSDDPKFKALAGPEGADFVGFLRTTAQNLARLDEIAKEGGSERLDQLLAERKAIAELAGQTRRTVLKMKLVGEGGVNFGVDFAHLNDLIASLRAFAGKNDLDFDIPAEAGDAFILNGSGVIYEFEIQGRSFAVIEENEGKGIALIYKDQHSETWYKVAQHTALSVGHN